MLNNIHYNFIVTPISRILKDSVNACRGIGCGINTQPLCEYIMQTTFLKMTGASEQKLKCICWEMATYDYEYRYQKLSKPLGECSCYDEKKNIFNDILNIIGNIDSNYDFDALFPNSWKKNILNEKKTLITQCVENSVWAIWESKSFQFFKSNALKITESSFANRIRDINAKTPYALFEKNLKEYYENVVYRHRNRCAHNLRSYQDNLPTLRTLVNPDYEYANYFHMYFVLLLLDTLYITLYKEYVRLLNNIIA